MIKLFCNNTKIVYALFLMKTEGWRKREASLIGTFTTFRTEENTGSQQGGETHNGGNLGVFGLMDELRRESLPQQNTYCYSERNNE